MIETARLLLPENAIEIAEGGSTRQESVSNGLALVATEAVVVHDAARPFVTADLVRSIIDALGDADAVVAAVPVDETLKRTHSDENSLSVEETVDRSRLWNAQTPAVFRTEKLRDAHRRARSEAFIGTDESQLIERYGGVVKLVSGTRANLKITFPEDFAVAEAMMRTRG
jgi:2-C-methyl-D-erythritol 4-phosphate cytidylyltransferase